MTDTMTSQNIVLSSWDTLYIIRIIYNVVPVLALISSRTLDFRESNCLFRGHEHLWVSTTTNNHGNLGTNLIITFIVFYYVAFCLN
jgi:hypothetical protein